MPETKQVAYFSDTLFLQMNTLYLFIQFLSNSTKEETNLKYTGITRFYHTNKVKK